MTYNSTLHVNYSRPDSANSNNYWLKMELVSTEEIVGKEEIAEVIDALYDIDPCDAEPKEEDAEQTEELPFDEQEFAEVIKDKLDPSFCDEIQDASYVAQVRIWKSHPDEPYRLQSTNGQIGQTVRESKTVTQIIAVNGVDSVQFGAPVHGNFTAQVSSGTLIDNFGQPIDMATTSTGLEFSTPVHGSMHVSYTTEYDLVNITVNGINGQPGTALLLAFYHGLVVELEISPPGGMGEDWNDRDKYCGPLIENFAGDDRPEDDITCYENITYQYKCECSNSIRYETTEQVTTPCPPLLKYCASPLSLMSDTVEEGDHFRCSQYLGSRTVLGGYVSCPEITYNNQTGQVDQSGENSVMAVASYYEDRCCKPPIESLPNCQIKWSKNPGGKSLDPAVETYYRKQWGNRVEFIGISPENNDCGTTKTTINDTARSCCDYVDPIIWDDESSVEVISDNSIGFVSFIGGRPPYRVSVRGSGFYLDATRTVRDGTTNNTGVVIYTADACGYATITVTDGCSVVTGIVKSTTGNWETLYLDNGGIEGPMDPAHPEKTGYAPGCPFIAPAYNQYVSGYNNYLTVAQEAFRITQFFYNFSCYGQFFLARSSYEELIAACSWADCVPFAGYRVGSCFTDANRGMSCMGTQLPDPNNSNLWQSYTLGRHTAYIPPDPTKTFWSGYQSTVAVINTKIEKWVC